MKKDRYGFDKEIFGYLKNEYKIALKCDLENFKDYEKLRNFINQETLDEETGRILDKKKRNESKSKNEGKLSEDSIKRHFEFITYKKAPSPAVCSLLARRLGYLGWDDFYKKAMQKYDPKSTFNIYDIYKFSSLLINEHITVGWPPEKYCTLKYLGDHSFEVIATSGLKSKVGRIFETMGFRLRHNDSQFAYPDIIIEPILDDDPDYELIELDLIPSKCLL